VTGWYRSYRIPNEPEVNRPRDDDGVGRPVQKRAGTVDRGVTGLSPKLIKRS